MLWFALITVGVMGQLYSAELSCSPTKKLIENVKKCYYGRKKLEFFEKPVYATNKKSKQKLRSGGQNMGRWIIVT